MKSVHLVTLNAILATGFGIAFALYGPLMIAMFGVPEIPEENVLLYWNVASFARLFGAALFGLGILIWSLRGILRSGSLTARGKRGILFALLLANGLGAFVSITQQFSIWLNSAGWVITGVFTVLFLGYVYFVFLPTNEKSNTERQRSGV
jgi:hypothetical protein